MDNGIYTEKIKQKLQDNEEVSLSEAETFFILCRNEKKKALEESRKEWKKVYRGFLKTLFLDKLKGAKSIDHLEYAIDHAVSFKEHSFENYQLLVDYADYSALNPSVDGLRIYYALSDYCDAYDSISTRFNQTILTRNANRVLVPSLIDMEEEETSLIENSRDLVDHVRQVVTVNKENIKRLVK